MKILYGIQGTGNGHIMRAREVIPVLQKKAEVDVLISGTQNSLPVPFSVNYRFRGLGFVFSKKGGIDYLRTYQQTKSLQFLNDIRELRLEKYDLIIQDFEPTIAWAGRLRNMPVVALSHQSAVLHEKAPQPKVNDPFGKQILKNYAPAKQAYGFHFKAYGQNIFTPVIRETVRKIKPTVKNHYTVYLPSYHDNYLIPFLSGFKDIYWQVFSPFANRTYSYEKLKVFPVSPEKFLQSMASATGVLCGAGFETPAEALFLKKKLLVVPMKNQYEQQCNAAALQQMGVTVIKTLKLKEKPAIRHWLTADQNINVYYPDQTALILSQIIEENVNPPYSYKRRANCMNVQRWKAKRKI